MTRGFEGLVGELTAFVKLRVSSDAILPLVVQLPAEQATRASLTSCQEVLSVEIQ